MSQFAAKAVGPGGILYSGLVGGAHSSEIALQLANETGLNIINKTARGLFLADANVDAAIQNVAAQLFQAVSRMGRIAGAHL